VKIKEVVRDSCLWEGGGGAGRKIITVLEGSQALSFWYEQYESENADEEIRMVTVVARS
jgi:hypothetical protein